MTKSTINYYESVFNAYREKFFINGKRNPAAIRAFMALVDITGLNPVLGNDNKLHIIAEA